MLGTAAQIEKKAQEPFILSPQAEKYIETVKSIASYKKPSYEAAENVFWKFYEQKIRETGKIVVVDDSLRIILQNSIKWLLDEGEYNPNMGLFFVGAKGRSKTQIMKALLRTAFYFQMPKQFKFNEAPFIFDECQYNKEFKISEFYGETRCFDDIGFSEPQILSFGQTMRPIESIMNKRYTRFINEGQLTHMTTNLSLNQLREHFDDRIIDRFSEMFNIVFFEGTSFRKK